MTRRRPRALARAMDTPLPSSEAPPVAPGPVADLRAEPEVAAFLATVRDTYRAPLPSDVTATHLRMILAEAAVAPSRPGVGERWARRARRLAAVGAVKIALTATAAAAATGTGLAATGNLPDAAQTAVAEAAERVGITLPTSGRDTPGDRQDVAGDPEPGIGQGGVPALLERDDVDEADLPGKAADAPGHDRSGDARPDTPARPDIPRDERAPKGDPARDRGAGRADARPEAPVSGDSSAPDTPAADTPAADTPADERPVPPAKPAAEDDGAAEDRAEPPAESRGKTRDVED